MTEPTNEQLELAAVFKALGDPTRLRIFEFLCSCHGDVAVGADGEVRTLVYQTASGSFPTVGDVCCRITGEEKVTSTMSFHLKELRQAGLITMRRRGKNFLCTVPADVPQRLALYFGAKQSEECCGCSTDSDDAG